MLSLCYLQRNDIIGARDKFERRSPITLLRWEERLASVFNIIGFNMPGIKLVPVTANSRIDVPARFFVQLKQQLFYILRTSASRNQERVIKCLFFSSTNANSRVARNGTTKARAASRTNDAVSTSETSGHFPPNYTAQLLRRQSSWCSNMPTVASFHIIPISFLIFLPFEAVCALCSWDIVVKLNGRLWCFQRASTSAPLSPHSYSLSVLSIHLTSLTHSYPIIQQNGRSGFRNYSLQEREREW
jgi:hypothetical protein